MPSSLPPTLAQIGPSLREFCRQHAALVGRLELFGSAARGDADTDSDVDLVVTFRPGTVTRDFTYFSLMERLREGLAARLGRPVDLLDAAALRSAVGAGGSLEAALRRDAQLVYGPDDLPA